MSRYLVQTKQQAFVGGHQNFKGMMIHIEHTPHAVSPVQPGSPYKDRVDFLTEASIMGQFHHPNVITLHGVVTKSKLIIIIQYCSEKNLEGNILKFPHI